MNGIDFPSVFWLLVAVQLLGVSSACFVRFCEGSTCQLIGQRAFFAALLLMGVATGVALTVGPGIWMACATSLAVMVLTATFDLRGSMQGVNP